MIDIQWIRANTEELKQICARRGVAFDVEGFLHVDRELRKATTELDALRRQKQRVGRAELELIQQLKTEIATLEQRQRELTEQRDRLWACLPNRLADDTPAGADDTENVEVTRWGEPPHFDFTPKPHEVLGRELGILDLERGAKIAGRGYYFWVGDGARLIAGMFTLALDFLQRAGFQPMLTPLVTREMSLFGTGYLPFFEDQIFRLMDGHGCLIGTSEQTLVGYHAGELLDKALLPLPYTAFSPCFRIEAGSHGRATRGAFRVHQFHKVEQVVFCRPEESEAWQQRCLELEEQFMQMLEIPYRVMRVCVGDLGAPAYKKFDIEGWFAGLGAYRETHSNSNLLDYQTRRLKIRYKDGPRTVYAHTISATMITDRALLAILENNQTRDGSVIVPECLRAFVGGKERLQARA